MTSPSGLNESVTTVLPEEDPLPFDNFAPTLAQCFFIVLAGYVSGKVELFSASDVRGVIMFATYFAMPGIICVSLSDADLENIEWQLLAGIVLGKAVIYGAVAGLTMLMTRPRNISKAGMLAMFSVHCNDLPVGNPLMSSLYATDRQHMMKYLFLVPALTLIFFSPLTHVLMDIESRRKRMAIKDDMNGVNKDPLKDSPNGTHKDKIKNTLCCSQMSGTARRSLYFQLMIRDIILNLMKNPVIIATFLGIMLNISFKAHVPSVLRRPINVVGTMIPGLALSVLGFSFLGKERHLFGRGILLAIQLIVIKMVVTPLVLFGCVKLFIGNQNKHLLDFSLLYGIISPASVIFQSQEIYRLSVDAMSAALILSSFGCFPLSYVIAKLSLITNYDLNDYMAGLSLIVLIAASVSLLCCMVVLVSFLWKKQWGTPPCSYVLCLAFTQVWMSCGIILWQVSDDSHHWTLVGQIILACGGEMAICMWAAILSFILVYSQSHIGVSNNGFFLLLIPAFGLSAVLTGVLCLSIDNMGVNDVFLFGHPRYYYGYLQLATTTGTLAFCFVTIGICLVLYMRRKGCSKPFTGAFTQTPETQTNGNQACAIHLETAETLDRENRISTISTASTIPAFDDEEEYKLYNAELVKTGENEKYLVFGAEWTFRYISLLTLLWTTMAIKLLTNVLKLGNCETIAITVPLEYLQAVLFTGQGFWTFLTFGFDIRTVFISLKKICRKILYGREELKLNPAAAEDDEVKKVCEQFRIFYYCHSLQEVARDRLWKKNYYKDSFWGHQMVQWLVRSGVVQDELEAVQYGQKLLHGGIISHIRSSHHFHDAPYLYYFVRNTTNCAKND